MKKILYYLGIIVIGSLALIWNPATARADVEGDYTYTVVAGSAAKITAYSGAGGDITIPDTLGGLPVYIGSNAFSGVSNVTSITISSGVLNVSDSSFNGCTGLTQIIVDASNANYSSDSGVLFNKTKTSLLRYPAGKSDTSYTIPDSVTSIGSYAFYGCSGLTSMTIPNTVTSLGYNSFQNCTGLTSVTIGSGLTSLPSWAFGGCTGLTSLTIPNTITTIRSSVFYGCAGLLSISIGSGATNIDINAFGNNPLLTQITVDASNANYSSDSGVLFNKTKTSLLRYPAAKPDTSYTIPDSVTSVGASAFKDCHKLTTLTIPNSVTTIGASAFYSCTSLISATIGSGVTNIGNSAFAYSSSMIAAFFLGNAPSTVGSVPFGATMSGFKVYYLTGKTGFTNPWRAYQTVANASSDAAMVLIDSNTLTSNLIKGFNPDLDNVTEALILSSSGLAYGSSVTWTSDTPDIVSDNGQVDRSILGQGDQAVTLTATITKGASTVNKDFALTVLAIPNDFTFVISGGEAQITGYNGGDPADMVLPDNLNGYPVTSIGDYALSWLGIKSLTISSSVTSIGEGAFQGNEIITSLFIPNNVTSIGTMAFADCYNLTMVYFSGDAPAMGDDIFFNVANGFGIYYPSGKIGFSDPWNIYTTNEAASLDDAYIDVDKNALSVDSIKGLNSDFSNITVALINPLPSLGTINNSTIAWLSGDTSLISNDGQTINRPVFAAGDAITTLTAVFTKGSASSTKVFDLTVLKQNGSSIADITSAAYTVTPGGTTGTIINVPFGTAKDTFLAALNKGQSDQTWNTSGIGSTVVSGNTLVVTAQNGSTSIVYTITVLPGSSKTESTNIGSPVTSPSAVGTGGFTITNGMNQTSNLGLVTAAGVNYLTYINSKAGFDIPGSRENFNLIVDNLDLFSNNIQLTVQSASRKIKLDLKIGETAQIGLDDDKTKDMEIKFAGLWVNRAELTVKTLSDTSKEEAAAISDASVMTAASSISSSSGKGLVFKRNLYYGLTGSDVKELQKYLNNNGFTVAQSGAGSSGQETMVFGPATKSALIRFQKAKNIFPAVGYLGLLTRKAVAGE